MMAVPIVGPDRRDRRAVLIDVRGAQAPEPFDSAPTRREFATILKWLAARRAAVLGSTADRVGASAHRP